MVIITERYPVVAVMHSSEELLRTICNSSVEEVEIVWWIKTLGVLVELAGKFLKYAIFTTFRLKKCLRVGMEKHAVQQKRDGKQIHKEISKNLAPSTSLSRNNSSECGSIGDSCKSSPSLIGSPNTAFTPLSNLNPSVSFLLRSSTSTLSPQNSSCALTQMVNDYCEQRRRRRAMLCNTLEELLSDDGETRLRGPATPEDYSAIYKVQMILMFEWAEKLGKYSLRYNRIRLL